MPPRDTSPAGTAAASGRWFKLHSPLGDDVLIVTRMSGEEGIARLFAFTLTVVSQKQSIAPGDLLGQSVTLDIACLRGDAAGSDDSDTDDQDDQDDLTSAQPTSSGSASAGGTPARYLNGIVTRFRAGRLLQSGVREYHIEVAPKLWVLQRTAAYRVFQNMTVSDILTKILTEHSITNQVNLLATYQAREYCVQYGETDFDFVTRLMHEEGIFYHFVHASDDHTMVLEDDKTWCSGTGRKIPYVPGQKASYDTINVFAFGPGLIDCTYLATDYNFTTPSADLSGKTTTSKAPSKDQGWQRQVHGVGIVATSQGSTTASNIDVTSAEADYEWGDGEGTDPGFAPGLLFQVEGLGQPVASSTASTAAASDDDDDTDDSDDGSSGSDPFFADTTFVVTEVRHDGVEPSRYTQPKDAPARPPYQNTFKCVPKGVALPRPIPPQKPLARGPMTALVVGPSGSEISTDQYGRIKVQFYWDQVGKKDENSSCWIRVAQLWSGSGWGAMFIPRVGMEVVVHFLDGDPDRPLVTGTVYNATNTTPWTLPDDMNKSGIVTNSTKGGGGFNALRFDDTKGSEELFIQAQYNLNCIVNNDETITVKHDQTSDIKNNRTVTVDEGNDSLTVKQGNRAVKVSQGDATLTVDTGNRTVTVSQGNATTDCSAGKIALTAAQSIKLTVGESSMELTPQGITLQAATISVKADVSLDMKAAMGSLKSDGVTTIGGALVKIN